MLYVYEDLLEAQEYNLKRLWGLHVGYWSSLLYLRSRRSRPFPSVPRWKLRPPFSTDVPQTRV